MEIVIVDTEFTAWEGSQERQWSGENEYPEIIQIAAIKFDISEQKIVSDPFHKYVKPAKNPILSSYIKNLTGISQKTVDDKGFYFKDAINYFLSFCGDAPIVCWGFEHIVFNANCTINQLEKHYFQKNYFNLRQYINDNFGNKLATHSGNLHKVLNLDISIQGHDHEALHDVYSIAHSLAHLLENNSLDKIDLIQQIKEHNE